MAKPLRKIERKWLLVMAWLLKRENDTLRRVPDGTKLLWEENDEHNRI